MQTKNAEYCHAHTRNGQQCKNRAVASGVCRMHGANAGRPRNGVPQSIIRSAEWQQSVKQIYDSQECGDLRWQFAEVMRASDYVRSVLEAARQRGDEKTALQAAAQLTTNNAIAAGIAKREAEIAIANDYLSRQQTELFQAELFATICDVTQQIAAEFATQGRITAVTAEELRDRCVEVLTQRMQRNVVMVPLKGAELSK